MKNNLIIIKYLNYKSFKVSSCLFVVDHLLSLFFIFQSSGVLLLGQLGRFDLFSLGFVDGFDQNGFIFELITLAG